MKIGLLVATSWFFAMPSFGQQLNFTTCAQCWNPDSLGNHRFIIHFSGTGRYARVLIPWRRRDHNPQEKRIIVVDATTDQRVRNVAAKNISRESGEIYFEPLSGAGTYYLYYMPYKNEGRSNYPKGVYLSPDTTAAATWLEGIDTAPVSMAVTDEMQSIDSFNSFYPMEIIATRKETQQLVNNNRAEPFLVFPEDRLHPIKMNSDLPERWTERGPSSNFTGQSSKGENFSFQLGIYALKNLDSVTVEFADLVSPFGKRIYSKDIFCINTEGTGYDGNPFFKRVDVTAGKIQALWCGINVPGDAEAGTYVGSGVVKAGNKWNKTVQIQLTVTNDLATNRGVNEPWKMTRLRWLNSTMAQQNTVIAPYTPLKVNGHVVSLLGRKLWISQQGLPEKIETFLSPEMTSYTSRPNELLESPINFVITGQTNGNTMTLTGKEFQFTQKDSGTVQWRAVSSNDTLEMAVTATMEFDGFISYKVKMTALQDVHLEQLSLQIPFKKEAAKYMMGLGQKGGVRPEKFSWKWDVAHKNQDGAWIGNVNAGLQYSLRDEKYVRPLNTNFYLLKPLLLPSSWGNEGKGGITITEESKSVLADNYSGERNLKKGDVLYYDFNLLITPFHAINTDFQWATRFYHAYRPLDTIKTTGATVINIHHATAINPYINYPFIAWKEMKAYIDSAHAMGLKVKIYNTIRELSDHAYETFALRSLGHEIYAPGKGGGFSWLQEHLDSDYIAAWFVPELKDAAIINSGMNRWHNYYVEGMNWLNQQVGIDGIYLDDVAFDRVTMKRIKRVLTAGGHPGIIDLHSANQYDKNDGFNNSANLYMENFPYLNRLWFGEYFDYENNAPDFFLTEVSGIPFGLMGEMLQGGGNPWRGMIYGMTNRMPWSDNADPRPIWKVWDDFGMEGSRMIGYWVPGNPVTTSDDRILATVYQKKGSALVAVASWAASDEDISLKIDWKKLGIDPSKATIRAPGIKNFQEGRSFGLHERIPVAKGKGWILIIK